MIKCQNCQARNVEDAATCNFCGQRLEKRSWLLRIFGAFGSGERQSPNDEGIYLMVKGLAEEAIAKFDEGIRLNPGNALIYINRSSAYDQLGQHEKALRDDNEAIRLSPELAEAYCGRALSYTSLGRVREAEKDITWAEDLGQDVTQLRIEIEARKNRR